MREYRIRDLMSEIPKDGYVTVDVWPDGANIGLIMRVHVSDPIIARLVRDARIRPRPHRDWICVVMMDSDMCMVRYSARY